MKSKYRKLLACLFLDLVGVASYLIPGITEYIDVIWAPLSAYLITKIFKNKISRYTAVVSFFEEALPFTDMIPTFTITWFLTYVYHKKD